MGFGTVLGAEYVARVAGMMWGRKEGNEPRKEAKKVVGKGD